MSLTPHPNRFTRRRLAYGLALFTFLSLTVLGAMAGNGWLPSLSGSEPGAVATGLAPPPTPGTSLSREYLYAGQRLLASEDANAPTPCNCEGNVASRLNGDHGFFANDRQQEHNFVAGFAVPDPGNEFQRADAAPEESLGDGCLKANDVQQVENYVAVLDPIRASGGPTKLAHPLNCAPPNPLEEPRPTMVGESATPVPGPERGVRIGPATGRRGQAVIVPVLMNLRVGETVTVFTLEYDAARFSNPRVALGANLHPTTMLTANTTQPGKIGIVVSTLAASFVTLPIELPFVLVTFDVRSTAAVGSTQIRMTSSIAIQSVADRSASLVPTRYTNGSVSVTN